MIHNGQLCGTEITRCKVGGKQTKKKIEAKKKSAGSQLTGGKLEKTGHWKQDLWVVFGQFKPVGSLDSGELRGVLVHILRPTQQSSAGF